MHKSLLTLALLSVLTYGKDYTNSIGMTFKDIPSGNFIMGSSTSECSPADEDAYKDCMNKVRDETPAHSVSVEGFYLSETEVTQKQWTALMGSNPSWNNKNNGKLPVERVSWYDVQRFIELLNQKEKTNRYRLPSEEEWEYAIRAGTTTKWYCADKEESLYSIAAYDIHSSIPVKSKKPNQWGLYDMSGNVAEWTNSCRASDYNSEKHCLFRSIRGGSWNDKADVCRSAKRAFGTPVNSYMSVGFRLLRTK